MTPTLELASARPGSRSGVTRSGGVVLASSFPTGADHPAKAVVEEVLEQYGY